MKVGGRTQCAVRGSLTPLALWERRGAAKRRKGEGATERRTRPTQAPAHDHPPRPTPQSTRPPSLLNLKLTALRHTLRRGPKWGYALVMLLAALLVWAEIYGTGGR